MKLKRVLALVLSLVMVFALVVPSFAADNITISASSNVAKVNKDDSFTVTLKVSAANNIGTIRAELKYDTAKLQFVSSSLGAFGKQFTSQQTVNNYPEDSYVGCSFVVSGDALNNASESVLCTVTFKVLTDVGGSVAPTLDVEDVYNGQYEKFTVTTVQPEVSIPYVANGVTLNKDKATLKTGDSLSLAATVQPSEAASTTSLTWTSSNTTVATVDNSGLVTAKTEGTTTITVKTNNGKTATCTITVVNCKHENTKLIAATDSTCTVKGHEAYTWCEDCKHALDASKNIIEIPYKDLIAHNFADEVVTEEHLAAAATCVALASYYKSCTMCHTNGTETFTFGNVDSTNHVGDKTYTSNNNDTHKVTCASCKTVINASEACSGGTATCKDQPICEKCGVKYGTTTPHTYTNKKYIYVKTVRNIAIEQLVCDVCDTPAVGQDARYRAYIDLNMVLNVKKDAGSTYDVPAGVVFTYTMTGKDSHAFAATKGGDETINHTHLFIGEDETEDGAISKLTALLKGDTWTVKQTSAGGNGWTVDATEYTVTFTVEGQTGFVTTNITKKVTKTKTTKDDATGKDVTETVVTNEPVNAIEFTNTYKSTTKYEPNPLKPAGGSTDTKKDNGKTVKSGKTFDAGIALYVGLSVLSVTGGALVIGKKKEF